MPFAAKAAEKPNVIIILADDLGYGDLQCYGARNVLTPNVDRLACEGGPMVSWGPMIETGYLTSPQLYDMRKDAGEKDNLAGKHRVVLRKLQKVLESL